MRAKKFRASCCGFLSAPHFKGHTSWVWCVIFYVARTPNIDFYVRFLVAPISLILLSLGCQDSVQVLDLHLTILEFFLQSHEFHPLLFRHIHLRENSVGWNKETNKWRILRGAQFPCSEAAKAVFLWGT